MLSLPPTVRVFVVVEPADMRGSFDALAGATRRLGLDPTDGHLYLHMSRRRKLTKVLWFDGSGWCILANQLSSHCTSFVPRNGSCSLDSRVTHGGRSVNKAIPSTAVLGGQRLGLFVEPSVLAVRVRLDDAVFDPAHQRVLVDLESHGHLFLRQ
jgi:transposase